ncbi:unnamed protein product, partial [Adineta ricciae]
MNSDEPKKPRMKNVRIQTMETAIPLDDEVRKYQRPSPANKNVRTRTKLMFDGFNNEIISHDRHQRKVPLQILNDSSAMPSRTYKTFDDQSEFMENEIIATSTPPMNGDQQIETTVNIANENELPSDPIIEYANELILPLAEACAPLNDI